MSLLTTIGQFLNWLDNALTINIPWVGLIWSICLLVIINAIIQVTINTAKQTTNKAKLISSSLGSLLLTTIIGIVGYYFFYFSFSKKIFKSIDGFTNYAMNIIPFSFILFWICLPVGAMYLFFSVRGITYYYKKKKDFYDWKHNSEKKETTPSLNDIVQRVEIKRAPDFRKWIKSLDDNQILAVKINDLYFIPVLSKSQQEKALKITGIAAAEDTVLVGKTKGDFEAVVINQAIIKVRSLLKKETNL